MVAQPDGTNQLKICITILPTDGTTQLKIFVRTPTDGTTQLKILFHDSTNK